LTPCCLRVHVWAFRRRWYWQCMLGYRAVWGAARGRCLLHSVALTVVAMQRLQLWKMRIMQEDLALACCQCMSSIQMAAALACACSLAVVVYSVLYIPCCLRRLCPMQTAKQQQLTRHSVVSGVSSCLVLVHNVMLDQRRLREHWALHSLAVFSLLGFACCVHRCCGHSCRYSIGTEHGAGRLQCRTSCQESVLPLKIRRRDQLMELGMLCQR
jgi:hypothetical protein